MEPKGKAEGEACIINRSPSLIAVFLFVSVITHKPKPSKHDGKHSD